MPFMLQVRIADQPVLIDAEDVQAVIQIDRLYPVPVVSGEIAGLITLRGAVITVVDAGAMLGGTRQPTGDGGVAVVVRLDGHGYALLCDSADEVFELAAGAMDPPPAGLDPAWRRVTVGIAMVGGGRLAIIDPLRLVPLPAAPLAA